MFRTSEGIVDARRTNRTVHFSSTDNSPSTAQMIGTKGILKDVLHIPNLRHDLISVDKLDLDGKWVIFGDRTCIVTDSPPLRLPVPL